MKMAAMVLSYQRLRIAACPRECQYEIGLVVTNRRSKQTPDGRDECDVVSPPHSYSKHLCFQSGEPWCGVVFILCLLL